MSDESKTGPRPLTKWQHLGIGLGVGGGFALGNIPNWRLVSGWLLFGVVCGLMSGIVQAPRLNR
jgi:hypothetical protein